MSVSKLAQFGTKHIAKGIGRLTSEVLESGSGSYVTNVEGKKMLDFTSGIGVTNLGHCHPAVTKAAQEQAGKLVHGQVNIAFHKPYLQLIESLLPLMPHKSLDTFFFWNSGSEAVEAAVKLARHATKKQNIIVMQGSYHGRTFGTMAMTRSKTIYGEGYGPLMPGVFSVPFPYCKQCSIATHSDGKYNYDNCCQDPVLQLELLLKRESAPSDTAAIVIEPVLGEGGYVPPPPGYLQKVRAICDKHNILLVADEVQSGFGRTGKMFAVEHFGVRPDILIMAKGIANGFPLSGIVSRKELMDLQKPGSMGGTYAGNAISCAAGVAVAKAFQDEKILENVNARGPELTSMLRDLARREATSKVIFDVRGLGLMLALECRPGHNYAARIQAACMARDMLILTTSIYDTIRFIPPLNITKEDMAKGVQIVREAIEEVAAEE
ncbi:putative L-ornithine aminotransferase Car2 [Taphrina deformans PYCC 5710]|uniref:L-ornithine aminotransferase Car2 n=1 Tax=Taphrina deformans (strain PYCC 5710 / ATCC 11124 / CBS 356.35 / IMI 108563 / JCM 9778 / NBRC 8474) TaxID=1097556 RepID=R4X780_TAPDE|nr:putative L-ornithine aminotransferase Car2 [Taphrina deformans PYCC 5710]|eukprot:CCG81141.1 putative L-ornithine aminotransferase Car2 [Taphrina deformans PYCC 5710]